MRPADPPLMLVSLGAAPDFVVTRTGEATRLRVRSKETAHGT